MRAMSLFSPRSVAIVGASNTPGKVGHDILENILKQGYNGEVLPINPKHDEVQGKKAYASISDLPKSVDLAIIITPAQTVPGILEECAKKKIQHVAVISAGFGETGSQEGKHMEADVRTIAQKAKIQLVGVNCLGLVRPSLQLNASFAKDMPPTGNVALVSQSGALAVAVMDQAKDYGIDFSLVLSIGNKTAMDECDFLELCRDDKETNAIGLYLESIRDGIRFRQLATDIAKEKPIVLIKAGVSEHGVQAVSSHTGSLAGSDAAVDALCLQTGIRRAGTYEEFLQLVAALSSMPPLLSNRVAIVTNAGGPGILATDAAEKVALQLPALSKKIDDALKKQLPSAASTHNPIDVLGDAQADRYIAALEACGDDPNIDGIALLLTPQAMTPANDVAKAAGTFRTKHPLMPLVAGFLGSENVQDATQTLRTLGIPACSSPESAVHVLANLQAIDDRTMPKENVDKKRAAKAQAIIGTPQQTDKPTLLDEETTQQLCELYALRTPRQSIATSANEAVKYANTIGYPVIAKVASKDIVHKTDIGGVRINLQSAKEVEKAYDDIVKNAKKNMPSATVHGVLIQQFLPAGDEFIVGIKRDPNFGPLILAGLGGIYTELFKDTASRLAPISIEDSYRMLEELQSWELLKGMRGKGQADIDALAAIIQKTAQLALECPQIVELDFNPVLVSEKEAVVADAKILVRAH